MEIIEVAGEAAIAELNRLRGEWSKTKQFPFLIGSDRDLEYFRDMTEPPSDPEEIIREAEALDLPAWLQERAPEKKARWPKKGLPAQTGIMGVNDVLSGKLKPSIHIGLVDLPVVWHLFAKLGYGGWNDCPPPEVQVALHKYWLGKYKVSPVYVGPDTVEMLVTAPVDNQEDALALAAEQYAYCYDIVEQGTETVGKLASSLLGSKYWYFWWD